MVVHIASTGNDIINEMLVEYIAQVYNGEYKVEYIIDRLLAFIKVTIRLIEPNRGDNPTKCNEEDIKSRIDQLVIDEGT